MAHTITPLTPHTGAEIRGLDLTKPVDAETRAALNAAFAKHHVLVVRDQKYEPADFKRAVQLWGELQPHDKKDHHIPGFPEMYYVTNQEFLGDRRMIPGETFHTDHSNHPAPPKATILYPVALPSRGGDTQYVNMHQAYDELSEAMKRKIDELKAIHVYLSKYSPRPLKPLNEESLKALPPPGIHPLVRVHPENGRKAIAADEPVGDRLAQLGGAGHRRILVPFVGVGREGLGQQGRGLVLRLPDRHQDRHVIDHRRHRVEQRAQRFERIVGKCVELWVERHARSCRASGNSPQVTRSFR